MADRFNIVHSVTPSLPERTLRRPKHSFSLAHSPWEITPFLLAPVLPGETLKNLLIQSRVVTDPLENALAGWWCEYYFFYVKHRDMPGRDDFTAMMLDPAKDMSAYEEITTHKTWSYNAIGGMKWVEQCLEVCVEEYFRNEGELWDDHKFSIAPIAQLGIDNWLDSTMNDADFVVPDIDVDINADTTIMASEVELAMQQWELLRHGGLTDQTYEDFLKSYGVRQARAELHKPELIRFLKEWTYPSNTVIPSTGAVSTACSWGITDRADKDRFFAEPGFIFGVSVVRPKVYLSSQKGAVAAFMNDAYTWLPAMLTNDFRTSMRKFAIGKGPIPGTTTAYWSDLRDLLLYGDQFTNRSLTATNANFVAVPTVGLLKRYAAVADMEGLFDDNVTPREKVYQDGIVSLSIMSTQRDQSHTTA